MCLETDIYFLKSLFNQILYNNYLYSINHYLVYCFEKFMSKCINGKTVLLDLTFTNHIIDIIHH